MFLIPSTKQYIIYADGGVRLGYGHLLRAFNLSKILGITSSCIFIYSNEIQKNFYKAKKVTFMLQSQLPAKEYELFILDSKKDKTQFLNRFQNFVKKILVIDNKLINEEFYTWMVLPSFFEDIQNADSLILDDQKILGGPEYLILDSKIWRVPTHLKKEHITISFGGSDPNNLTLLVLKKLETLIALDNIKVILGPGYKHDQVLITNILNKAQIIHNPENIYEIFAKSLIVITAFGVTLQELFSLGIPAGIVANYREDFQDFLKIQKYYQNINQKILFSFLGVRDNINETEVLNSINASKDAIQPVRSDKLQGKGWEELRHTLLNKTEI